MSRTWGDLSYEEVLEEFDHGEAEKILVGLDSFIKVPKNGSKKPVRFSLEEIEDIWDNAENNWKELSQQEKLSPKNKEIQKLAIIAKKAKAELEDLYNLDDDVDLEDNEEIPVIMPEVTTGKLIHVSELLSDPESLGAKDFLLLMTLIPYLVVPTNELPKELQTLIAAQKV